jgi:hypothetical protein
MARTGGKSKGTNKGGPGVKPPELPLDPAQVPNTSDPGDATARNYRYQYGYGVILLVAARRGDLPYLAIWCEHHEDFLAERSDGRFDGYQVKTSRPELGAWTLRDTELVKSIGRFVDLVALFGDRISKLLFVSNTECDMVTPVSTDAPRRSACPKLFLEHVKSCFLAADIQEPYASTFAKLQASCGCDADALFSVVKRMDIILGPSRNEFDSVLSHEHLPRVEGCKSLAAAQLDKFRDDLIALVHRASSLQVTDPTRHIRALINGGEPDPALVQKRIVVREAVVYCSGPIKAPFKFPGEPALAIGAPRQGIVLEEKLKRGGLADEVEYMRGRERAAEYHLLEDIDRRSDEYPALLTQLEQMVLGECLEAHLRARQSADPYGPKMMIDVQDRLKRLASERPEMIGNHPYECLMGIAGLLTSECRVWWSPRFVVPEGAR